MYTIHKTRPSNGVYFALVPFAILVLTAITGVVCGLRSAYHFLAIIFWGYAAYSFLTVLRTYNLNFLVVALFQALTGGLMFIAAPALKNDPQMKAMLVVMAASVLLCLVGAMALSINKKLKWRGREILELAASNVEETGNGYTPRPLPAGKTELTKQQIEAFARFSRQNLLAVTYKGKDKLVFVPVVAGREALFILGLKVDYTDETWIAMDFSGNISVSISHRDYLGYKDSLAFERLCSSLANLFVEFVTLHQHGEGVRIISRLDAINIPWYA